MSNINPKQHFCIFDLSTIVINDVSVTKG